ncbi:MAG: hypothetical protein ABI406_05160 [Ktedonobacteraceae bacterium]
MATIAKPPSSPTSRTVSAKRMWHTPTSKAAMYWFLFAFFYCGLFYALYGLLLKAPILTGPWFDHVFRVGVMSYIMILAVTAYSLRTRFLHNLPWKAQNWVWMHLWLCIAAVFLAFLHADFSFVLHWDCSAGQNCITAHFWGMPSLYALIFIALSGALGRLLDLWQTRIIAQDASTNGTGIAKAIQEHLTELEYIIERLCAGKSTPFKHYCASATKSIGQPPTNLPPVPLHEQNDFQQAYQALINHACLAASLKKQQTARRIFRTWRYIHMSLVPLALLIITYHAFAELLVNVMHVM